MTIIIDTQQPIDDWTNMWNLYIFFDKKKFHQITARQENIWYDLHDFNIVYQKICKTFMCYQIKAMNIVGLNTYRL